ncbi:F-box protein At5g07610-like [Prunus avium]|uniref:F-box protein At5g07610-like n=1 Tax=Prunus avium TaxID=42229 RepID=A0A6P5TBP9_PRUAV|nr:F-box protein At5g07610-like [Prunus avium]
MFNLDDLPDFLLVEILCRIPQKSAVQCMCVSKRWYGLVSDPYFVGRFLRLQSDNQVPINTYFLFTNPKNKRKLFFDVWEKEPKRTSDLSLLSFLPPFQEPPAVSVNTRGGEPIVVGEYNDLLLCCATTWFQRYYYICNPYTKQWDALPPPPQCYKSIRVGFICDPYYNTTSTSSTIFQLNAEYRYSVVRLLPEFPGLENSSSSQFKAQIFSSETGKWTESVVLSPRSFRFDNLACNAGVACNGMLYWWSAAHADDGSFIIGLDPYSNNSSSTGGDHNKYYLRFIDKPENEDGYIDLVGVCNREGCLRMCLLDSYGNISVFDFKDDQVVDSAAAGKWCLVGKTSMYPLFLEKLTREGRWVDKFMGLAFDPSNKDKIYLEWDQHIFVLDIRLGLFWEGWEPPCSFSPILVGRVAFPVVLQWWPTPVTRHKWTSSSSNRVPEGHGGPRTRSSTRKRPRSQNRRFLIAEIKMKIR